MNVRILVAHAGHTGYAERICELMYDSALERGTGIACRPVEYIREKITSGKAVIALDGKSWQGSPTLKPGATSLLLPIPDLL